MQNTLFLAGILLALIGILHSWMGEVLVFQRWRESKAVVATGAGLPRESHLRILWATWHLASVLGWGVAAVLLHFGWRGFDAADGFVLHTLSLAVAAGGLLVLGATRGKHPGWIGLLLVAGLVEVSLVNA